NIKEKKSDVWDKVNSVAPGETDNYIFHHYHELKKGVEDLPAKTESVRRDDKRIEILKQVRDENDGNREQDASIAKILPNLIKKQKTNSGFHPIQTLRKKIHNTACAIEDGMARFFSVKRVVKVTTVAALLLIIPSQTNSYYHNFKNTTNKIASDSTQGFASLQDSTAAMMGADLPAAQSSLTDALQKFETAAETLDTKYKWLKNVASAIPFVKDEVQSRQRLLLAGQKIALGNTYLLKGIGESQADNDMALTERVAIITIHLKAALPNYQEAMENINGVKPETLPLEYQTSFVDFSQLFGAIVNDMENMVDLGQAVQEIFGAEGLRRYLLVFQNPAEIRPTGGFAGSFAVMDVKDGKIVNMTVPAGGSYDLQGQLSESVVPPSPLLLANKRWEFQDANWFPDFSASAEKLLWFYRKSRGSTCDGVIAINASVLERLLSIVGPVIDEKRGLTLTSANALPIIQNVVETGEEKKENKPKQILTDLAPKFLEYFSNIKPANLLPLLTNLEESLEQKEIQTYFTDEKTQNTMKSFGWAGKILPINHTQDYLMAVNTNIQGQKSDAKIKQHISHQAVVQDDGTIIDSVVITREHTGNNEEKLYGETNIDYIRLYVPEGSELLSAGGFTWPDENKFKVPDAWSKKDKTLNNLEKEIKYDEKSGTRITNEFGKTAFGNWVITEPGQKTEIQFVYRLPFKAFMPNQQNVDESWKKMFYNNKQTGGYQLILQRQSGSESTFESQAVFPLDWSPFWKDGTNMQLASNGFKVPSTPLNKDTAWSLMMIK
ncbi:MAG: DUF4012 domain-containing protein, partial [bacterium]